MAIDHERLMAWPFPEIVQDYTAKDTILYALGIGMAADPTDADELQFVYEAQLQAMPTLAVVLAYPGFWLQDPGTGVDWKRVLHGEQGLVMHRPLPPVGSVRGRTRVEAIIDKGEGKGALIYTSREIFDMASGELICTLSSTSFCRGDGGFGGAPGPTRPPHAVPNRTPDRTCDTTTLPQAALIYRLSGDMNPLHADPVVARAGGFERPILHGLATYGAAGRAVLRTLCGSRPARLRRLDARFSAPVFPGETIRTEMWVDGLGKAAFRARVVERDRVVLDNGLAEFNPG